MKDTTKIETLEIIKKAEEDRPRNVINNLNTKDLESSTIDVLRSYLNINRFSSNYRVKELKKIGLIEKDLQRSRRGRYQEYYIYKLTKKGQKFLESNIWS